MTKLKDRVEILGKLFQSVFTTEDTSAPPTLEMQYVSDMPSIVIFTYGVQQPLRHIQSYKASVPYAISARLLKECASNIAPVLLDIFRRSLKTGNVTADWRDANISSVVMKG